MDLKNKIRIKKLLDDIVLLLEEKPESKVEADMSNVIDARGMFDNSVLLISVSDMSSVTDLNNLSNLEERK